MSRVSTPDARSLRALIFDFDHTLTDLGRWVNWKGARDEVMALYRGEGLDPEQVTRRTYAFGLFAALAAVAPRLASYPSRLAEAAGAIATGDSRFVANPRVDSLHQVWFELHEDVLVTLGRSRAT